MKKIVLLLVILMLLVVGCNTAPETAEETEDVDDTEDLVKEEMEEPEVIVETNNPLIDEWCLAGTTYDVSSTDGSVSTIIEGLETYKGKEYCKGVQTTNIEGVGEIQTTYYFTYEGQEMWVISTVAEQTTELHIMDGELVA
ncbi:MAG: hypothetical protein ABIB43_01095 [archaeon]